MGRTVDGAFGLNSYSYTFSRSALNFIRERAEVGFHHFELMAYPGHLWPSETTPDQVRDIRNEVERGGLTLTTLNQPNIDINLAGATPEMRAYSLAVVESIVELAGSTGAGGVIIGPGKANPLLPCPAERLEGWFHAALDRLLPVAERNGVELLVENMPFAFLPGVAELMAAVERHGGPVAYVYDVANGAFIGEDVGAALRALGSRLRLVHLSDTTRAVYEHAPVGLPGSVVPFKEVHSVLRAIGHDAPPILELITPTPDEAIAESAARLRDLGWEARPAGPTRATPPPSSPR